MLNRNAKSLAELAASAGSGNSDNGDAPPPPAPARGATSLAALAARAGVGVGRGGGAAAPAAPSRFESLLQLAAKAKAQGVEPPSPGSPLATATGTLKVRLERAAGLKAADPNGKSDPYVVLETGGLKTQKSSVVPKTLDPVWNESFEFAGTLQQFLGTGLELRFWDKDTSASTTPSEE